MFDLILIGGQSDECDIYVGKLIVIFGSVLSIVVLQWVVLVKGVVDFNLVDFYEFNDIMVEVKLISYGKMIELVYIFGKLCDVDFFSFIGKVGDNIQVDVYVCMVIGGLFDLFLVLCDVSGKNFVYNDDVNGQDLVIIFKLFVDGIYFLEVLSCNILCKFNGDDVSKGQDDDSFFNKYVFEL